MLSSDYERMIIMKRHLYTEAELTEIRSNPFTFSASPGKVVFTLAFKKFVLQNVDKPRMTIKKVFAMAGYPEYLFSQVSRERMVARFRKEAASPQGLQEPVAPKTPSTSKKRTTTEVKELQERVTILEQQLNFLKKSQWLKNQNHLKPPNSSN